MSEPLQPRHVPFYDDELVAVQQPDGAIFVVFTRVCDALGLKRWSQARRVQAHAVLQTGLVTLTVQTEGGPQETQWIIGRSSRARDDASIYGQAGGGI